jgi:hypothetical protein
VVDVMAYTTAEEEGMTTQREVGMADIDLEVVQAFADIQTNRSSVEELVTAGMADSYVDHTCSRRTEVAGDSPEETVSTGDHAAVEVCEAAYLVEDEAWPADVGSSCRLASVVAALGSSPSSREGRDDAKVKVRNC